MKTDPKEILRTKINMETSRIHWKELQRFFASGAAIMVSNDLDLIDVALQMHDDNKTQFEAWLKSGLIHKVKDEQAASWLAIDAEVWAVVVCPWVLVQNITQSLPH